MSKEYVARISYGKDSLAMLECIKRLGLPLIRITTSDVWATETLPAALPEVVEWQAYADAEIEKRYGIKVEHLVCSKMLGMSKEKITFEDVFYTVRHSKRGDAPYGWPLSSAGGGCYAQKLKIMVTEPKVPWRIEYLGVAADEADRIATHGSRNNVELPLVKAGWTEQMCHDWCEANGLLSPRYADGQKRDGCFFGPAQNTESLRKLRHEHPDLWKLMLQWDADSPVVFRPEGHTLHDYELRFYMEDNDEIDPNRRFMWETIGIAKSRRKPKEESKEESSE